MNVSRALLVAVLTPTLAAALHACSRGSKSEKSASASTGALTGYVYDTNRAVLRGLVVRASNATVTTADDGSFKLSRVQAGRLTVYAEHASKSTGVRRATIYGNQTSYLEFTLAEALDTTFDPKGAGALRRGDGAAAVFPASSLQRADGTSPQGVARLTLAALDPTDARQLTATPGQLVARRNGRIGMLEPYSPVEVRLHDAEGERLQLAAGHRATVSFPISDNIQTPPEMVDLWSLDEQTGEWTHEGVAMQELDEQGARVFRAQISHLSWWSVSAFVEAVTCVRGCVREVSDAPEIGASVTLIQQGGRSFVTDTTDLSGCFHVNVSQSSEYLLTAVSAAGASTQRAIATDDVAKTVEENASACEDLGVLALNELMFDAGGPCPPGTALCRGRCTDTSSDPALCGESCDVALPCPPGAQCVAGECEAEGATCGATTCPPLETSEVEPCCAKDYAGHDVCGVRTKNRAGLQGAGCQPRHAPGVASESCGSANTPLSDAGAGSIALILPDISSVPIGFPGCCTPSGYCSADLNRGVTASGPYPSFAFGCLAPEYVFPAGVRTTCDPISGRASTMSQADADVATGSDAIVDVPAEMDAGT